MAVILYFYIYDYLHKENGIFAKTRDGLEFLGVILGMGVSLFLIRFQHIYIFAENIGPSEIIPETYLYPFYIGFSYLLYRVFKFIRRESKENIVVIILCLLVALFVAFSQKIDVFKGLGIAILPFLPILISKKGKSDWGQSIFVLIFSVGISHYISLYNSNWTPSEQFYSIYQFPHHVSFVLFFLGGWRYFVLFQEIKSFKQSTIWGRIIVVWESLLVILYAGLAYYQEFHSGIYTASLGVFHSLIVHLTFLLLGFTIPNLFSSRSEILSSPKDWMQKYSKSVPVILLFLFYLLSFLPSQRKVSLGTDFGVGTSVEKIKSVLGKPDLEDDGTLKYYKISIGNERIRLRESIPRDVYLLEFHLTENSCGENKEKLVSGITARFYPDSKIYPYYSFRALEIEWNGVSGWDTPNPSLESLGELIAKSNVAAYTENEDSNPGEGGNLYLNLSLLGKSGILPVTFSYWNVKRNVLLTSFSVGENSKTCQLYSNLGKGVKNRILDAAIFSQIELVNDTSFVVPENVALYSEPKQGSKQILTLLKGMVLHPKIRMKENSEWNGKSGTWYFFAGGWVFSSLLEAGSDLKPSDYPLIAADQREVSWKQWNTEAEKYCDLRKQKYRPTSGSLPWSLMERKVRIPMRLGKVEYSNENVYLSVFPFDFSHLNFSYVFSDGTVNDFIEENVLTSAYSENKISDPFEIIVAGTFSWKTECSPSNSDRFLSMTTAKFKEEEVYFTLPQEDLLDFGTFKTIKGKFFLSYENYQKAQKYCSNLGLELIKESELEELVVIGKKFNLPINTETKGYYWSLEKGTVSNVQVSEPLRTICVSR
ncbi:hypothetical protein [Leptospira neocaledonica]|uniref:hypothetical protein n=1 Tax=Leptospira neocaledonica TaxID=2023192 RepID=UPI000F647B2C|nr:hypothetical protein [Leptospira neocaledonica]